MIPIFTNKMQKDDPSKQYFVGGDYDHIRRALTTRVFEHMIELSVTPTEFSRIIFAIYGSVHSDNTCSYCPYIIGVLNYILIFYPDKHDYIVECLREVLRTFNKDGKNDELLSGILRSVCVKPMHRDR